MNLGGSTSATADRGKRLLLETPATTATVVTQPVFRIKLRRVLVVAHVVVVVVVVRSGSSGNM